MEAALSLGSNLGDRLEHLRDARKRIGALPGVTIKECSKVYETEPVGVRPEHTDKPFLNVVIVLRVRGKVDALFEALQRIESDLGRTRTDDRHAPRTIDIDLLYADEAAAHGEGLILPHPRWAERRFVVQPLADVRPDRLLPGEWRTVREVLYDLPEKPAVSVLREVW
jgi:2-amino-4-hydroxy-6-hydroxymethyldihydropteridine diphosphokinase